MGIDDRNRIAFGGEGLERLSASRVCVVGLGGVGAAAALDLVRAGVGTVVAVDFDTVQESNLNRLAFGFGEFVGKPKIDAFAELAERIRSGCRVETVGALVRGDDPGSYLPDACDVWLDCIDTLNAKVNLVAWLLSGGRLFVSSMGTAGRLAPERLRVSSAWDVAGDPLAHRVRQRLRRLGATGDFTAVWSDEPPIPPASPDDGSTPGELRDGARVRAVQGSSPFVPQAAGHLMASVAVRMLLGLWTAPSRSVARSVPRGARTEGATA
ncbi:MAG: ThiF family adenylyltransferase [Spirochaetales bacterium]|nr:ThiF family adenylyltransferase [Spirochaetales bacterium]